MIFDTAMDRAGETALSDTVRSRTWAELSERATRLARWIREEAALEPDDHATVLMSNRVEYVEITLAALLSGIWLTPVNRHLASAEISYVIEDSGAKLLFCDEDHREMACVAAGVGQRALGESGGRNAPSAGKYSSSGGRSTSDVQIVCTGAGLEACIRSGADRAMPVDGPAGGTMFYTSGTTGRPKGVKRARAENLEAAFQAMAAAGATLGLDGSGPHLVTGPLYHAAPLLFALYDQVNGAPMIIMPKWEEGHALRLIAQWGVRHTHMVPTMFVRLLRKYRKISSKYNVMHEIEKMPDVSSLTLLLHGAAPVAEQVKRRMIDWWGEILVEYWGATEGGVCTLVDSRDWLDHPGTVGHATVNFEIFARDEDGRVLDPGETGELYCRHRKLDRVFEYHGDAAKTAAAHPEPGLFSSGDLGRVDADGYVYLADRKSNMIISGGVNIYPAEVEQVLQQHPAVADAGVFGIPDDEWGESVKAAVELLPGFVAGRSTERDILDFARGKLAAYKVPRSVDFEDRLPRHPTGKLLIIELRDRYWEGRAKKI